MTIERSKLKQIRWFSNGSWQFQPHLHFMQNMSGDSFAQHVANMSHGGVVKVKEDFFKMEIEHGLE